MSEAETSRPNKRRIPHRIETERLILRCYEPSDAEELRSLVTKNIDHLGEYMPWVQFEPQDLDQKLELVLGFRAQYDADTNHVMGIFRKDTGRLIGGTGLHPVQTERGSGAGDGAGPIEIGYWIDQGQEGNGFVTECVRALSLIAFRFRPLARLIIRMELANSRSESIPQKLGYQREGIMRKAIGYPNDVSPEDRRDCIAYSLLRNELEAAPWLASTEASLQVFDALHRPLAL